MVIGQQIARSCSIWKETFPIKSHVVERYDDFKQLSHLKAYDANGVVKEGAVHLHMAFSATLPAIFCNREAQ
ncbi:MAG: hypothetical protein HQK51_00685 [Oligoflexia bacterium]|nr:hypothetical protein [Oligoflexia bacterium]